MLIIDISKYGQEAINLVTKLSEHKNDIRYVQKYMNDEEKKDFISNLKKLLDIDKIPFAEKMVIVREVCAYSREITELVFGKK